jgi:hypothetical protein
MNTNKSRFKPDDIAAFDSEQIFLQAIFFENKSHDTS